MSKSCSLAVTALVLASFSAPLPAQCPDWTPGLFTSPGVDGIANAQIVFDDGSGPALYIGANTVYDGIGLVGVGRWNGTVLQPVTGAGLTPFAIYSLAVLVDGTGSHLCAGGVFVTGTIESAGIARWDGSNWSLLGGPSDGNVYVLESFDADGSGPGPAQLYAGGEFLHVGGVATSHIARWDGTAWAPLASGCSSAVYALTAFDADGTGPAAATLCAGGAFGGSGGVATSRVAAWDGTAWSALGPGLDGYVRALRSFDADGSGPGPELLYAGGAFQGGCATWDGSSWAPLPFVGEEHEVYVLAVHDEDGAGPLPARLVAAGEIEGNGIEGVARLVNGAWAALGAGVEGELRSLASFDDGTGPKLFAGGIFTHAVGQRAQSIAQWDGSSWSPIRRGNGLSSEVFAVRTYDDGTGRALYAGGTFDYAGPVEAGGIARWDGTRWSALGTGTDGSVFSLGTFDDGSGPALYAGGTFTHAGGTFANHVARWNGTSWSPVGAGFDSWPITFLVHDDGSGSKLYAGGEFPGHIAAWDGVAWSLVGGGTNNSVVSLAVHDEGDGLGPALYAAGTFVSAGGVPANRVARWRAGAWTALGSGVSNAALTLASFDDGNGPMLVVGGLFNSAGGAPAQRLARWSNASWHPFGSGVQPAPNNVPIVDASLVHDDGTGRGAALYVAGFFSAIDGVAAMSVARWDGSAWSGLDGGVDGLVRALTPFDDGQGVGAALYVCGEMSYAGLVSTRGLARYENCGLTGQAVCAGDGSGTPCPCGNDSAPGSNAGCTNSLGLGGRLVATGFASLGTDHLVLSGSQMPDAPALYFQGTTALANQAGVVFGDGLRCAGGNVMRLGIQTNAQGASSYPPAGGLPVSVQGAVTAPGVRVYQVWYRNAASFCTGSTFNLTNGLSVLWSP